MIKGITKSGFSFEIEENALDDMRIIDAMAVAMADDADNAERLAANSTASVLILGKEQRARLYDHIAARCEGRVPIAEFEAELADILNGAGRSAEKN